MHIFDRSSCPNYGTSVDASNGNSQRISFLRLQELKEEVSKAFLKYDFINDCNRDDKKLLSEFIYTALDFIECEYLSRVKDKFEPVFLKPGNEKTVNTILLSYLRLKERKRDSTAFSFKLLGVEPQVSPLDVSDALGEFIRRLKQPFFDGYVVAIFVKKLLEALNGKPLNLNYLSGLDEKRQKLAVPQLNKDNIPKAFQILAKNQKLLEEQAINKTVQGSGGEIKVHRELTLDSLSNNVIENLARLRIPADSHKKFKLRLKTPKLPKFRYYKVRVMRHLGATLQQLVKFQRHDPKVQISYLALSKTWTPILFRGELPYSTEDVLEPITEGLLYYYGRLFKPIQGEVEDVRPICRDTLNQMFKSIPNPMPQPPSNVVISGHHING
ncbi:hypothetical protein DdX_06668 [Ditylenchus destructor]|uniref:Uncharacterized protein n=1 Tax=Ditylenchus destructor TaxID=166010 RepID=A0AAD4R5X9_9BILA|nr:hypothetical protein DdX_06668 [Ditylenchus destructor]